jgi:hypothetical protein
MIDFASSCAYYYSQSPVSEAPLPFRSLLPAHSAKESTFIRHYVPLSSLSSSCPRTSGTRKVKTSHFAHLQLQVRLTDLAFLQCCKTRGMLVLSPSGMAGSYNETRSFVMPFGRHQNTPSVVSRFAALPPPLLGTHEVLYIYSTEHRPAVTHSVDESVSLFVAGRSVLLRKCNKRLGNAKMRAVYNKTRG